MKNFCRIIIAMVTLTIPTFGIAQSNGNDLYRWLNDARSLTGDPFNNGVAHGFIVGVAAASPNICYPKDVRNVQLISITWQYLEKYPERRHLNPTDLVRTALMEKFPCSK